MAGRIRSVKPEWMDDEKLAHASLAARVLSIGLILLADDHGRGRAHPVDVGAAVFRAEPNPRDLANDALIELASPKVEFVTLYTVRGQQYFAIRNWKRHQRVDKPSAPRVPSPDDPEATPTKLEKTSANSQIRESLASPRGDLASPRESLASPRGDLASPRESVGSHHDSGPPLASTAAQPETTSNHVATGETSANSQIRESLASPRGDLATDLRSPISDHDPENKQNARAREWSTTWCAGEITEAAVDDPLFADGDVSSATALIASLAKRLAGLAPELRFVDLRAEATEWFIHGRGKATEAKDAGQPWSRERTLVEVEAKASWRIKSRPLHARGERERARRERDREQKRERFDRDGAEDDDVDIDSLPTRPTVGP